MIKNSLKASLVLHMRQLKEDNERTKNITLNGTESVKAVRLKSSGQSGGYGEDLWCGFVEQVSFKSGMEERGSDGWCDVCFR